MKELVGKKEKGGGVHLIYHMAFTFECGSKNVIGLFQPIQVQCETYVQIFLNFNQ